MKVLLLPVATIVTFAAACCCCGDEFSSELNGLGIDVPSEGTSVTVDGGSAGGGSGGAVSGEVLAGTCGRFKEMGLKQPSGMSVTVCSEGGGADSIVLSGSAAPGDACKSAKGTAEGAGWAIEADTSFGDNYATTMTKGSERLSIACTTMGGSTNLAMSISPQ
jgi:hypothetical protein